MNDELLEVKPTGCQFKGAQSGFGFEEHADVGDAVGFQVAAAPQRVSVRPLAHLQTHDAFTGVPTSPATTRRAHIGRVCDWPSPGLARGHHTEEDELQRGLRRPRCSTEGLGCFVPAAVQFFNSFRLLKIYIFRVSIFLLASSGFD